MKTLTKEQLKNFEIDNYTIENVEYNNEYFILTYSKKLLISSIPVMYNLVDDENVKNSIESTLKAAKAKNVQDEYFEFLSRIKDEEQRNRIHSERLQSYLKTRE